VWSSSYNELKRCGRADKEEYINELCRSVEYANHQNKSRLVYQGVKRICGKKKFFRVGTIKDKNGTPFSDMAQIKSRWKEHFDELYNVKITADKTVLLDLPLSSENDTADAKTDTLALLREEVE